MWELISLILCTGDECRDGLPGSQIPADASSCLQTNQMVGGPTSIPVETSYHAPFERREQTNAQSPSVQTRLL